MSLGRKGSSLVCFGGETAKSPIDYLICPAFSGDRILSFEIDSGISHWPKVVKLLLRCYYPRLRGKKRKTLISWFQIRSFIFEKRNCLRLACVKHIVHFTYSFDRCGKSCSNDGLWTPKRRASWKKALFKIIVKKLTLKKSSSEALM